MAKITLITTNQYGKKDKEFQLDLSQVALAFVSKGNYIDLEGIEYYIGAVKTTVEDGRLVNIKAKLTLDSAKF